VATNLRLPTRFGISRRRLFDQVAEHKQFTVYVVSGHAGFDPDQAWWRVHKSCGHKSARAHGICGTLASLITLFHFSTSALI